MRSQQQSEQPKQPIMRQSSLAVRRQTRALGAQEMAATLPGVAAWGLITGIAMVKSGLTSMQALGMTLLIYSGTAQLVMLPMLAAGASLLAIAAAVALVNLRFAIYSMALAPDLRRVPFWTRMLVGYLSIDAAVATYLERRRKKIKTPQRTHFILGANIPVWSVWQLGSIAGIFLAGMLPAGDAIAYLGVLAILTIVFKRLNNQAAWVAGVLALIVSLIGINWPHKLGVFAAVLAGVAGALLSEKLTEESSKNEGANNA
jgi:predicted branched-subunit amino acid permease